MEKLVKELREKYRKVLRMTHKFTNAKERRTMFTNAQTILIEMKRKLKEVLSNPRLPMKLYDRFLGMLIVVLFKLGVVALELGNLKQGLSYLDKVMVLIPDTLARPTPAYVLAAVEVRNVIAAEYIDLNPTVSAIMVDEADRIYCNFKRAFPKSPPYSYYDHFAENMTMLGGDQLNESHSLTKFHLRQFSRPVQYYYKSLEHAYKSLQKMATAEITDLSSRAEIAIILGEYFINEREFHYGRYLLSIAAYVIDKYEENTKDLVASMKAMRINENKGRMKVLQKGKSHKSDKYISMIVEKGFGEPEFPLKDNEILVEVEEMKKVKQVPLGENEILVEVEDKDGEAYSSEEDILYEERRKKKNGRSTNGVWIEYEEPTIEEEIKGWRAFLSRAWAKYGLHLMKYASQTINEPRAEVKRHLKRFPKIKNLDLSKYENIVSDEYPKTVEEAGPIFLFTQYRLIEAKNYYSMATYAHEHVALAQEHSLLIRYMMKYEHDGKALRKYLKARIRLLEPVSFQLNYKYYLPACRLLWFELGKIYHELLQHKFETIIGKRGSSLRKAIGSVNNYCSSGMAHFHNYIDSFETKNLKAHDPVTVEAVAKLAFAQFYLGRMYYAYITFDQEEANDYTLAAYSCFRYVVKHCKKDTTVMEALKYQYELLDALRVGHYKNKLLLMRYNEEL